MRKLYFVGASLLSLGLLACGGGGSSGSGSLEFSEIMYQGAGADSLEFIELHNGADTSVPLSGLLISGAVEYQFASDVSDLKPGAYVVITNLPDLFAERYPGVLAYGPYTGRLSNAGESLKALMADSTKLASCDYGSGIRWPAMAAGGGYSLVYVGGDQAEASSWKASLVAGGNPGGKDQAAPDLVVAVNEVLPGGTTDSGFVELVNNSAKAVDVGGWWLTDSIGNADPYVIPAGSSIPANGFLLLSQADWNGSFFPATTGDKVYLIKTTDGAATGSSVGLHYLGLEEGSSAGLVTMSDGTIETGIFATPTPGEANGSMDVGPLVISEVMYHPLATGAEYIELTNIGTDTLLLGDPSVLNNAWKVDGVGFQFPMGSVLAPQGKVLLIKASDSDPVTFRETYGVPAVVMIYTYADKLSNSGEKLEVKRPQQAVSEVGGTVEYVFTWSDIVAYTDSLPWPVEADGDGKALQRKNLSVAGSDPTNWVAADPTPGN